MMARKPSKRDEVDTHFEFYQTDNKGGRIRRKGPEGAWKGEWDILKRKKTKNKRGEAKKRGE